MTTAARSAPRSPTIILVFLLLAYILNFLDRQILSILAQPIKKDLSLTDTEFGAIAGLAFALLYSFAGVPLSYLADRTGRSKVIAGSLAVWSGFTALCGFAGGYWSMFLCRLGVGVGEAGGVAPSYALIADYFPPEKRGRALGIYSLGVPIGLGSGLIVGAYIATYINWRAAFVIMGGIGLILVPFFLWVVKDVPRPAGTVQQVRIGEVWAIVSRKPSFWLLAIAASLSSLCGYGLAVWVPSVLILSYDLTLLQAGQFMGSLLLIGGVIGVLAGGIFADRLGHGDKSWYAKLPAFAWLIALPCFLFGLTTDNLWLAWPPLADCQRHEHPVARTDHHRGPESGRTGKARYCLLDVPAHQQPHRARRRTAADRRDFRLPEVDLRTRQPALCSDRRGALLRSGRHHGAGRKPLSDPRLG